MKNDLSSQNGKIEQPMDPGRTNNVHDCIHLNNDFQLDGVQRVRDDQVT